MSRFGLRNEVMWVVLVGQNWHEFERITGLDGMQIGMVEGDLSSFFNLSCNQL